MIDRPNKLAPLSADEDPNELSLMDLVLSTALESQKKALTEHLEAGISIHYRDTNENWVKENPDGSIDIVRSKKS